MKGMAVEEMRVPGRNFSANGPKTANAALCRILPIQAAASRRRITNVMRGARTPSRVGQVSISSPRRARTIWS